MMARISKSISLPKIIRTARRCIASDWSRRSAVILECQTASWVKDVAMNSTHKMNEIAIVTCGAVGCAIETSRRGRDCRAGTWTSIRN